MPATFTAETAPKDDDGRTWPSADAWGIPLTDPVAVNHQGSLLLFARERGKQADRLYVNIRTQDPDAADEDDTWTGWLPIDLNQRTKGEPLPGVEKGLVPLLRIGGMSLITLPPLAGKPEARDNDFAVVSDGRYLCIFRLSKDLRLYLNRLILVQLPGDQPQSRDTTEPKPNPRLQQAWETRFRRSGKKHIPDGPKDTLGVRDMTDQPFFEPTQELDLFKHVPQGRFAVLLVPTAGGGRRWHLIAANGDKNEVLFWSFPYEAVDGVSLDPKDVRSFTLTPKLHTAKHLLPLYLQGGVGAALYGDQDPAKADGTSIRRYAHVMVAVPVRTEVRGLPQAIALYDFSLLQDGTLPPFDGRIGACLLDGDIDDQGFTPRTQGVERYPVPQDAVHCVNQGVVWAGLVGQLQPSAPPFLMEGSDGLVHLYFCGQEGTGPARRDRAFLAAQYDPTQTRPTARLPWEAKGQTGVFTLVAQRGGTTLNALKVEVKALPDDGDGQAADLCTLAIHYGLQAGLPDEETWHGVPREIRGCAAVLNGEAGPAAADPDVQAGKKVFYDYQGCHAQVRLPVGDEKEVTGRLTLVGRRLDAPLTAAVLNPKGQSTATLRLTFFDGKKSLSQTWDNFPRDSTAAAAVLRGAAAPSLHTYGCGPDDAQVFGLSTSTGTILFFAPAPAAGQSLPTLTVTAAGNGRDDACHLTLTADQPAAVDDIPREQTAFIAALRQIPAFDLFTAISGDPCAGRVTDQTLSPLDLRCVALLLDVVGPAQSGQLQQADLKARVLQGHTPAADAPDRLLWLQAVPGATPSNGFPALLCTDKTPTVVPGRNGAWLVPKPRYAISMEPKAGNAMDVPVKTVAARALRVRDQLTIEAWIKPGSGRDMRVLSSRLDQDDPKAPAGAIQQCYLIGTEGRNALHFSVYDNPHTWTPSCIWVKNGKTNDFVFEKDFTWEAWIKPDYPSAPPDLHGCFIQVWNRRDPGPRPDYRFLVLALSVDRNGDLLAWYNTLKGMVQFGTTRQPMCNNTQWHHVALSGVELRKAGRDHLPRFAFTLYLDGRIVATKEDDLAMYYVGPPEDPLVVLGSCGIPHASMFGALMEVRYWTTARGPADIMRTMHTTLRGTEPGLHAYWPLTEVPGLNQEKMKDAVVRKGSPSLDGVCVGGWQPWESRPDGVFNLVAGIGGLTPVTARAFMLAERWSHVAVSFRAGTGITLTNLDKNQPPQYLDCGHPAELDFGGSATWEMWIQRPKGPGDGALISKWGLAGFEQAYQLVVHETGCVTLFLALVLDGAPSPSIFEAHAPNLLADGNLHHLAVTYSTDTRPDDKNPGGLSTEVKVEFFCDVKCTSTKKRCFPAKTISLRASPENVLLGSAAAMREKSGERIMAVVEQKPLTATFTGVRFWNRALKPIEVWKAYSRRQSCDTQGAVAAWWFQEQRGEFSIDTVGGLKARLSDSDLWTTLRELSRMSCYVNGNEVPQLRATAKQEYCREVQFTLGAERTATANYEKHFNGQLAELRFWGLERTAAQIQGTCFRPLLGLETGLSAYWPFEKNALDCVAGNQGARTTGPGALTYEVSTAPVASEGPQLRLAWGGVETTYQRPMIGTPAVLEFGEAQRGTDGVPIGVMKRGYYFLERTLVRPRGFGIGDLDTVYLGQVQTQPTLLGFIEGPPPVPSENLTRPYYANALASTGYYNASAITLTQSRSSTFTFSANHLSSGSETDVSWWVGGIVKTGLNLGYSSPPASLTMNVANVDMKAHYKSKATNTITGSETQQIAAGWLDTLTDSVSMRGRWETKDNVSNPEVGRRFIPANEGYALVESLTADLYGLRLKGRSSIVSTLVLPNPLIPPDRNIIHFPIDPRYIKNGTLDGKIGFRNDPDYADADTRRGSYFKPAAAYIQKARIECQRDRLAAFHAQFDAVGRGRNGNPDLSDTLKRQFYDWDQGRGQQSFVNTYVWSARGGLHKEQEQLVSRRVRTYTGTSKFKFLQGVLVDAQIAYTVGAQGGVDFLAGHLMEVSVSKGQEEQAGFGLDLALAGESLLERLGPDGQYSGELCPGKVDSYRFMTFYLAPDKANAEAFRDQVIDQAWLATSSDPGAIALRGAALSKTLPWRVYHRVTYVSRVPPNMDSKPVQTPSKTVEQPIQIEGNEALIRLVQGVMTGQPATEPNIAAAVRKVLNPLPTDPEYPNGLLDKLVPCWGGFLAKTRARAGKDPIPEAQELLQVLVRDVLSYMRDGFATHLLPLPDKKPG